jgi:hypothetical protein
MKIKLIIVLMMIMGKTEAQQIFNFKTANDLGNWYVVDDVVMGGRSQGDMEIDQNGNGIFEGTVSLENNGGFSSIRYRLEDFSTKDRSIFKIRIKGDGKNYQFRVKSSYRERQSYVYEFKTTGKWQIIAIPFDEMYPSFRGRNLNMPNYPGQQLQECSFLISNKKNESFRLLIDRIWIE